MGDKSVVLDPSSQKLTWAHGLFYCQQVMRNFSSLVKASHACLNRVLSAYQVWRDNHQKLLTNISVNASKGKLLMERIQRDTDHRKNCTSSGTTNSVDMSQSVLVEVEAIQAKINQLQQTLPNVLPKWDARLRELQHFISCRAAKMEQDITMTNSQTTVNYDKLRQYQKEHKMIENEEMFKCVMQCRTLEKNFSQHVRDAVTKMNTLYYETILLQIKQFSSSLSDLKCFSENLDDLECAYSTNLWKLIFQNDKKSSSSCRQITSDDIQSILETSDESGSVLDCLKGLQLDDVDQVIHNNISSRHSVHHLISRLGTP